MGRDALALVPVVLVAMSGAAACDATDGAHPVPPNRSSGTCATSNVQTGPLPAEYRALYGEGESPPWIRADAFVAVLFYATSAEPVMGTGGKMPDGARKTKILWLLDERGPLTIKGTRTGSEETFTQVEPSDSSQHPSIIEVPSPGCWTLTAHLEGESLGSITIPVVEAA